MSQPISKAALGIQKELIRECMRNGVGIEFLDDSAPSFRLVPPPKTVADDEALDQYAKPSKRPSVRVKCHNRRNCACHKSKWYKHRPLDASPMYSQPMMGDCDDLTVARRLYSEGKPQALRDWLGATAAERVETWAEIDALLPMPLHDTMTRAPMTPQQFRSARERLDMTQVELADWGGVTSRTIIRFENGQAEVPELWRKALDMLIRTRGK